MRRPLRAARVTSRHPGAALTIPTKQATQRGAWKRRLHWHAQLHQALWPSYAQPARQPTMVAAARRPSSCRSSERRIISYLSVCEQRTVMRSRVWRAGASETHTHSTARTLKQTPHLQQLPARSRRDRDPGAPPRSCPDRLRSRPASRPSTGPKPAGAAALRETPEIRPKMPVSSLPSPKLGQSSAQNQRQSKSRKPSFKSNVGGVGPVVADALDRPRRPILTGAAASKGNVLFCIKNRYVVSKSDT